MLIVPLLQRGLLLRKLLFPAFLADKKQFVDRIKKQYICQRQNEKPEFQAVLRPYGAIISKGNPKIDQRRGKRQNHKRQRKMLPHLILCAEETDFKSMQHKPAQYVGKGSHRIFFRFPCIMKFFPDQLPERDFDKEKLNYKL